MTDTTTSTPPAGGAPGAPAPQQPAPAPTAPANGAPAANPAATNAGGQSAPAATVDQPAQGGAKTFTQEDVDRIVTDRMSRFEKSFGDKLAGLFGAKAEGDTNASGGDVLAQARQIVEQAQARANTATARSFAAGAVKDDRVAPLLAMLDLGAVLKDVDQGNPAAVDTAIKAAVDAEAAKFPEWARTATPPLPGSSTANPHQPTGDGKRIYTRSELEAMTGDELAKIADDLTLAAREGRIK